MIQEIFNKYFEQADKLEFNEKWANKTGYYDNFPFHDYPNMVAFVDSYNRRAVFFPQLKTLIFERYPLGQRHVYVSNAAINCDLFHTCLRESDMIFLDNLVSETVTRNDVLTYLRDDMLSISMDRIEMVLGLNGIDQEIRLFVKEIQNHFAGGKHYIPKEEFNQFVSSL